MGVICNFFRFLETVSSPLSPIPLCKSVSATIALCNTQAPSAIKLHALISCSQSVGCLWLCWNKLAFLGSCSNYGLDPYSGSEGNSWVNQSNIPQCFSLEETPFSSNGNIWDEHRVLFNSYKILWEDARSHQYPEIFLPIPFMLQLWKVHYLIGKWHRFHAGMSMIENPSFLLTYLLYSANSIAYNVLPDGAHFG